MGCCGLAMCSSLHSANVWSGALGKVWLSAGWGGVDDSSEVGHHFGNGSDKFVLLCQDPLNLVCEFLRGLQLPYTKGARKSAIG